MADKFAFSPQKSKMTRRSFLTGGASSLARAGARGLMSAPEEEYYYDEFSGTAGKAGQGIEHGGDAHYWEHHSTLSNGTKVHKSKYDGSLQLRTMAKSRSHAHSKFLEHTAYYGEPEWSDD